MKLLAVRLHSLPAQTNGSFRSHQISQKSWTIEFSSAVDTLSKLSYNPLGVSPSKGKQGTTRDKEKTFWPRWESFMALK